jgi:chromosomal replication initiation ATPase DnaA
MNDFTFDNFVKLDSNQIALEVIEDFFNSMKYGCVYNPIVILGLEGNGKSHLIQAIKKRIEIEYPSKKLKLLNPDILKQEIRLIRKQIATVTPIREIMSQLSLHENEILIFEDFHSLTPREETLRALGVEFCKLLKKGHHLIITSSKAPQISWSAMYTMKDVFLKSTLICLHTPIQFRDKEKLDNFFKEKYKLKESSNILDSIYEKDFISFKELEERVIELLD